MRTNGRKGWGFIQVLGRIVGGRGLNRFVEVQGYGHRTGMSTAAVLYIQ